jgi:putative transposase
VSATVLASCVQTWQTTNSPITNYLRCDLLCAAHWLPMALLARELSPWQTVFYHFRRLRLKGTWFRLLTALREAERERVGRNVQPSAAIMDAQSVKTVEESAGICGFDAHKCVKGRKRRYVIGTVR